MKDATLLDDPRETFPALKKYNIKLNPTKCLFGVPAGQLLGYLLSARGIEANPEKIAAIDNMRQPRNIRDIQKFTGCLASLSRFISRLGEKALPLYHLLKKTDKFVWSEMKPASSGRCSDQSIISVRCYRSRNKITRTTRSSYMECTWQ